ncbi:MAG: hypothetical protein HA496_07910 [Thaumarchaeota archaeon]|jgi:hypothetical protein|nr:hypothetical protein [Nitrososphaerota archaeon]
MSRLLNLKPLILLILFNYVVIIFGSYVFYTIQVNIERTLRALPRLLVGFIQASVGLLLILLWIFVWLSMYKHLFTREIRKDAGENASSNQA